MKKPASPTRPKSASANIDADQAREFIEAHLKIVPSEVKLIGEGAWSRCFGFHHGDQELAIRFGKYLDDFEKDRVACEYAGPGLPIPEVTEIGQAFDGYYSIATRVHGVPLESVDGDQWHALLPSLVSAMEAMRVADLSATSGFGGWGSEQKASHSCWSEYLLSVAEDTPDQRGGGWRERLVTAPEDDAAFTWGYELLKEVASDTIPRSLIHGDLINRNVLVAGDALSGVFDWGCSKYGDHLYELAWFEFWAPWYPDLDMRLLRSELEKRWQATGCMPVDKQRRLAACYLHIGLEHLAYNAFLSDWTTLSATAERMRALVNEIEW